MKPSRKNLICRALMACAISLTIPSAYADKTWTGATDGLWATTTNWFEGALPGATDVVIFDSNSAANLSIDTGAAQNIKGISLSNPSGNVTLNNNTVTIGASGINLSSAAQDLVLNSTVAFSSGKQIWNAASGRQISTAAIPTKAISTPAVVQLNKSGTIKLGSAASNLLVDAQSNAWGTYGDNDWAALDATGNVIAATYTTATTALTTGVINDIQGNIGVVGFTSLVNAIRFDSATSYNLDIANSSTSRTFTCGGILVTPNAAASSIGANGRTNAFIRPNRASGGATHMLNVIQNSANDFTIHSVIGNSSASTAMLVKSGTGKLIVLGNSGNTGGTTVHEGILQIGNGGTTGSIHATLGAIVNNSELIINRSNAVANSNSISGSGKLTKEGAGVWTVTGANSYTGLTHIKGGFIAISASTAFGATSEIKLEGGGIQWDAAADVSTFPITLAGSVTFHTLADVILANSIGNNGSGSLTKTGANKLTLAGANTYTGTTTVSAGNLVITNTSGSATGTGNVTIESSATLSGTGSLSGAVTASSGSILSPGITVGTVTTGDLTLQAGATLDFEFNGSANDTISAGNLTINGGAITLRLEGLATPFAAAGTYNLIQYSGSISGTGVSALSIANPQSGFNYNFGTSGGFVTLTITTSGLVADWITDGPGAWGTSANWSGGSIPDNIGNTARLNTSLTNASSITLDAARTLGSLSFTSANSYTVEAGSSGSLTMNATTGNASLAANAGMHNISAPVSLADTLDIATPLSTTGLTLSGIVSGTGGINKTGTGNLTLSAANSFSGNVHLAGGTASFANGGLGVGSSLNLENTTLQWASGNTQDITSKAVSLSSGTVGLDTNGNDVILANDLTGSGQLTKLGAGKLTLVSDTSFTGNVTISGGTLQLGAGSTTGIINGDILNNGSLILDIEDASPVVFNNIISGTGSLVHQSSGTTELTQANTFSGITTITAGVLKLANSLALQQSTVELSNTVGSGTLSFGALTAATFGNLSGNGNLVLSNAAETPLAVALTIGANNTTTSYDGVLSGPGSLSKIGSGTVTLNGTNTYTGATTVTGAGSLTIEGAISTASLAISLNGVFTVNNNVSTITGATTLTSSTTDAVTSASIVINGGEISFLGPINTSNANAAYSIKVNGGAVNATDITLGRSALNYSTEPSAGDVNSGLYLNGGDVSISGALNLGTPTAANSSVSTRIDSGTLSVAGPVTVGLNNGGRWSIIDVNGGNFVSSNAAVGVALGSNFVGNATLVVRNSGIAKVKRIQMGQADLTGTSVINVYTSGELAVGSGGIVKTSTNAGFVSTIKLESATLSAYESWSTSLPIQVNGTTDAVTFRAADINGDPYDMTLNGAISGVSSVSKTGAGTVTMSGANTYTGDTFVNQGTLSKTKKTFADSADVYLASTGTLNLAFSGGDAIDELYIDNALQAAGTWGSLTSTADNKTALITGNGILYVGIPAPASEYGTWSALLANGLTANVNDGEAQDPDNDGIANLLEFVLGGLPMQAAQNILPAQSVTGSNLDFQFTRSDESESEVTLTVQYSSDLQNWTDIAVGASSAGMVTVAENGAAADAISVSIPKDSNTKLFARLKAVK